MDAQNRVLSNIDQVSAANESTAKQRESFTAGSNGSRSRSAKRRSKSSKGKEAGNFNITLKN